MGRTLTHTHTHRQHTCTHTRRIPLNEAASSASALHLLCPPVSSPRSAFIKPSTHSHTLTHSHIVCTAKRSDYPPLPLLLLGHITPLACRALKSINSFWSCTNRDSLRFLSLHLPLSSSLYLLLFSMRLFCPLYCLFHLPLANLFVAQIVLAFKAKQLLCCVFF